jgi:hypothetical protein
MARYEETLQVKGSGSAVRDANGDWITPDGVWASVSECRDEPNDKGTKIEGEDGEAVTYGSLVFLPEDCPEVIRGSEIRVIDSESNVVLQGTARRFKRYRKNAKLWV